MKSPDGTFGFFQVGIPVVFIRSDILCEIDQDCWRMPQLEVSRAPLGKVRARAKLFHELRHFHDSLLNPRLFSEFLVNCGQSILTLLLFGGRGTPDEAQKTRIIESQFQNLKELEASLLEYSNRYAVVFNTKEISKFGLLDALEVLAVCVEAYVILLECHKIDDDAPPEIIEKITTKRYQNLIFGLAGQKEVDAQTLECVHDLVFEVLVNSGCPIQELADLLDSDIPASKYSRRDTSSWKTGDDPKLPSSFTQIPRLPYQENETIQKITVSCRDIEELRSELISRHFQTVSSLAKYVSSLEELPLPPTCFFADEKSIGTRSLPITTKSRLRRCYGDVFTATNFRNEDFSTTVAAGLIPTLGTAPCLSLPKVHIAMSCRFLSQGLIGEKISFSPHIDESIRNSQLTHLQPR